MAQKRKDLMDDIKFRLNTEPYNMSHYAKNEKDLREKVKFFAKKEAAGELKGYMATRYEAAKALLTRLQALKSGAPLPPAAFEPTAVEAAVAEGVAAANTVPVAKKTRRKTAKKNIGAPVAANNMQVRPPANKPKRAKTVRIRNTPEEVENEHLYRAIEELGKIPELFDPYTGRKFAPEENPFPPIEQAYKELVKLRSKVYKKAQTYRSRSRNLGAGVNVAEV